MELWEMEARESIRDLVARYNANGDSGRIDQVIDLFAEDAVMVLSDGVERRGRSQIRSIFESASSGARWAGGPRYVRHMTSTHQIELQDPERASGRCYYAVITPVGLDHWGRYLDEYRRDNGEWRFSKRRATLDGRIPTSVFVPKTGTG